MDNKNNDNCNLLTVKFFLITYIFSLFFCFSQNPQTKKITNKFFPDNDIIINTPSFQKKKGFTDYEEMMSFINDLIIKHPHKLKLNFIGKSQKGYKVPMLILKNDNKKKKIKVWFQGGLHGNEPASTEGMLFIVSELLNNSKYNYLTENIELAIVPMANIDGFIKQDRYASNGLDLNRDQTKLMVKESIFLKKSFSDFSPHVAVDFHEYRPYRKDFVHFCEFGITSIYDVMFLYSGNLNVPKSLRNYTKNIFIDRAKIDLENYGFNTHDYFSTTKKKGDIYFKKGSSNSRSSATSYALTNCISALIEVRGVGIGKTSFKRRVESTFLTGISFLETTNSNFHNIFHEIDKAINSNQPISIKSESKLLDSKISAICLDDNNKINLEVKMLDALQSVAIETRERPLAYLIPSNNIEIVEKLRILGLELEYVESNQKYFVEKYIVDEYFREGIKYEGVFRQVVSTSLINDNKSFIDGVYILNLPQRNSNLAFEVLEPEGVNSFVSFGVIETELNNELPIYRLIKN